MLFCVCVCVCVCVERERETYICGQMKYCMNKFKVKTRSKIGKELISGSVVKVRKFCTRTGRGLNHKWVAQDGFGQGQLDVVI